MSSCIYHLSKQCRNEDRESWDHTYIHPCICFCWHPDRKQDWKKEVFMGICSRNVILYDPYLDLVDFSKKYRSVFHRKDHSMFLMYCRRNFRWNACYLKMNMIQYSKLFYENQEDDKMKHIKTLTNKTLQNTVKKGGCGECQTSCQSACKTSCTVGNQTCEHSK